MCTSLDYILCTGDLGYFLYAPSVKAHKDRYNCDRSKSGMLTVSESDMENSGSNMENSGSNMENSVNSIIHFSVVDFCFIANTDLHYKIRTVESE